MDICKPNKDAGIKYTLAAYGCKYPPWTCQSWQHDTTPSKLSHSTDLVSLEAGDHDRAVGAGVRREACLVEAVEKLERHLPLAAVRAEYI